MAEPLNRLDGLVAILDVLDSMSKRDARAVLTVLRSMDTWDNLETIFEWKTKGASKKAAAPAEADAADNGGGDGDDDDDDGGKVEPSPMLALPEPAAGHERRCRVCGCTDDDCRQCIEKTGLACVWVEPDLCSACCDDEQSHAPDR